MNELILKVIATFLGILDYTMIIIVYYLILEPRAMEK